MHQASIIFTAFVMAMGGAWYVMQDARRSDAEGVAVEQVEKPAISVAMAEPLAD
jgi:hypothetical protein